MVLQCCHCKTSGPLRCRHLLQVGLASPTLVCFRALQRRHSVRQGAPPPPGPRAGPDRGAARAPALRPLAPGPLAAHRCRFASRQLQVRPERGRLLRIEERAACIISTEVFRAFKCMHPTYSLPSLPLGQLSNVERAAL